MKTPWEFVERYYPKYSSDKDIMLSDDLQKIVDGEHNQDGEDSESFKLYKSMESELKVHWGGTMDESELHNAVIGEAENLLAKLNESIYRKAIEGFINEQV